MSKVHLVSVEIPLELAQHLLEQTRDFEIKLSRTDEEILTDALKEAISDA